MNTKSVTTSGRLTRNAISNIVLFVTTTAISFFMVPFFLGQIGEERYGVWMLIASIFAYRNLLCMGLDSSINRFVPVYIAKNDYGGIQRVINTSLFFFSCLSIVLILATLVIYYNVSNWFAIGQDLSSTASMLVLVVGLCAACAMPMQLSSAVLSGLQRYDIMNLAVLIPVLARTILLVVLLLRGYGLITMGLIFGGSEIAIRLLQLTFARILMPQFSLSFSDIDLRLLQEMLAYGINTFLYLMGAIIIYQASHLVIGAFIGTAEVAQFAIATRAVLLLSQFISALTKAIKPAVSDLDARKEHLRVREIAFLTQKYSLLLIIPAGCFLVVMGKEFLWVWVGQKFQDPTVINSMSIILAILAVGHCLRLAQHSNFLVLVGKGDHKIFGILTAAAAIACVVLSVLSIKVLTLGLMGIAWSNFLPLAIISGVILPIYFNWKMRISIRDSIRHVWWPVLLGCLPSVTVISVWKYLAPPAGWSGIFAVVVTSMVVTLVCGWFLSLSALERKRFSEILVPRKLRL